MISLPSSIPVRIKGYEDYEYYLLTITGQCSSIDYEKSESFIKSPFSPTGKQIEAKSGLYFDLISWEEKVERKSLRLSGTFTLKFKLFNFSLGNKVIVKLLNN